MRSASRMVIASGWIATSGLTVADFFGVIATFLTLASTALTRQGVIREKPNAWVRRKE